MATKAVCLLIERAVKMKVKIAFPCYRGRLNEAGKENKKGVEGVGGRRRRAKSLHYDSVSLVVFSVHRNGPPVEHMVPPCLRTSPTN